MSCVACSAHTKASGDHRASTRCVSRILACALRRDTMAAAAAAAAALYVSPLFCTPWTEALMANVSLSCRLAGFSGCRSSFLSLLFFPFLYLILFLEVYSSRRTLVIISRKISFSRPRPRREIPPCTSIASERGWQVWMGETVGWKSRKGTRGNKSVQRGWKRNCFVSESTVCVLAWLTPWSPLPPFLLLG